MTSETQTPTVTLTGPACHGLVADRLHMRAVADLPAAVKLGCQLRPDRHALLLRLRPLAMFVNKLKAAPPPAKVDYYTKAMASLSRMYLNDQEGDCVIAGKYHLLGGWSANDSDSGGVVTGTDREVQDAYNRLKAGRGDSGCVITDVLDAFQRAGLTASGKTYKIDGYVAVDNTSADLAKWAIDVMGGLTLGLDLPSAWTNSDVWDVTNSRSVGGHDVSAVGYDDQFVYISSWGRIYRMTWAAFTAKRYVTECYAMLSPLWYGPDKVSPPGLNLEQLRAALQQLGGGQTPDVPPAPTPVPPGPGPQPTPPPVTRAVVVIPDQQVYTGTFPFGRTVTIPGGTYPVVSGTASAPAALPRRIGLLDLIALLRKIGPLVGDLGPLVRDVRALVAAIQAHNLAELPADARAVLEDVRAILADLGIVPAPAQNAACDDDKVFVGFPEKRAA